MTEVLFVPTVNDDLIQQPYPLINVALAAGGTADIPGPAVGFLRLYDQILICADSLAAATTGITLVLIDANTVSWSCTSAGITGTDSRQATLATPLGFGEIIRVSNAGANPAHVFSTYIDIPTANTTLVRMSITNAAPQIVIPAPPAGYYNRWLQHYNRVAQQQTINSRAQWNNPDVVSHSLQQFYGGVFTARSAALVAANGSAWPTPGCVAVVGASAPLACNLTEVVNTTAPHILGAYQTLPL